MDIAGLVIFAFLTYIRPQDFVPFLSEGRLVVWVMFFTVAAWVLKEARWRTTRFPLLATDWWMCCLLGMVILSTINVRWLGLSVAVAVEMAKCLILFLMVSVVLDSERKLGGFLCSVLFFTVVMCGLACLQRLGIDVFNVGMVGGNRIQGPGIFNNPNYLAYAAVYAMPVGIWLGFRQRNGFCRIAGLMALAVLVLTVVLTQSRGGVIAMVVVMSYAVVQRRSVRVRWVAGVLAAAGVFLLMKYGVVRMGTLGEMRGDAAVMGRIDSWYAGFLMLKSSPLLGIGYGQYLVYFRLAAHSSFVQVAAEAGLLGLFFWTGLLFHSFRGVRLLMKEKAVSEEYLLTVEGILLAYCMTGLFATMGLYITLFIACGLATAVQRIALQRLNDKRTHLLASRGFSIRHLAVVGFFVVGILVVWHILIRILG